MKEFTVGVSGASWAGPRIRELSVELGYEIARRNYVLLCGGMKTGVMKAVCEGASRVESRKPVVGILPGADKKEGNSFLDVTIPTGLGYIRNTILAIASDVVVAVSGGAGTLSEVAFAWQYNVPIVLLSSSGGWAEKLGGTGLDHRQGKIFVQVKSVAEAMTEIEKIYNRATETERYHG